MLPIKNPYGRWSKAEPSKSEALEKKRLHMDISGGDKQVDVATKRIATKGWKVYGVKKLGKNRHEYTHRIEYEN